MTQLPQDEFETCLEKAEAWMKEIHERLKENDNTQGPRSALESRLRESEKICALEPDGKLLLDLVLSKAENLLGESSDDEKHDIHIRLGKIKSMFDETTTYMTHCHSRIEWVWLHWNEYLRARDEFSHWVHDMTLMLEPDMELQLGRKEKGWQYEQAQVLLRDVNNHSKLLDRLLEEASSLYNRIGDPSVDESVQSAMVNEYKQIKKRTQERTKCLEKIWRDHEAYEKEVNLFKSWLNGVIEKLKCCVGSASESTEIRLNMLQEIGKDVEIGKKQLELLEERSVEIIKDTSPLGAEKICKELEELRRTLDELKIMNDEEEEGLLKTYNSENAFLQLARQLEANINEFRKAVQRLEESLESGEKVKNEEELIALWKTLNVTKSALAGLEAKAERVKVQLKDLFKFSKDIQPLSDSVIAAMREYQRAKSKAFKLSTDTESELRQLFQNPLREFLYWKPIAESVLDSTAAAANNGAVNPEALDRIETLLEESSLIKEKLAALEAKDGINSVLGDDRTKLLLKDVAAAEAEREALHRDLLERKSQLQSLAAQSEEFDSAFRLLHQKLSALRMKCAKEYAMQPDIIGKEAQLQRFKILLDELTELHTPIKELNSKTEDSPNHAHRASKLLSDYLKLQRSLESNMWNMKKYINYHRMFNNGLLDLKHWMMETQQELESSLDDSKDWGDKEVEAILFEFPEKDIQRHQVEAHGQKVIESSSPEGAALVHTELKQLIESWEALRHLCELLSRSLKKRASQKSSPTSVVMNQTFNFLTEEDLHSSYLTPERGSPGSVQSPETRNPRLVQGPETRNPGSVPGLEMRNPGSVQSPEMRNPGSVQSPETRNPGLVRTPETRIPGLTRTTETKNPGSLGTPEMRNQGSVRTPETRIPGLIRTVETRNPGSAQTPEMRNPGSAQTPEMRNPGSAQTPEMRNPGSAQTPEMRNFGSAQTPEMRNLGSAQTPEMRNLGSAQTPEMRNLGSIQTPEMRNPGSAQTPETRKASNTQDVLRISVQYDDMDTGDEGGHHGVFSGTDNGGYSSSTSSKADNSEIGDRTQAGHSGNLGGKQDVVQIGAQYDDRYSGDEGGHRGSFSGSDYKTTGSLVTKDSDNSGPSGFAHPAFTISFGKSISKSDILGELDTNSFRSERSPGSGHVQLSSSSDYKTTGSFVTKDSDNSGPSGSGQPAFSISKNNESFRPTITGKANSSLSNTDVDSVHNGSSRITSPSHGFRPSDKSTKSVKSLTDTTNGKSRIPRPTGVSRFPDESSKAVKSPAVRTVTNGKDSAEGGHGEELNSSFNISRNKTKLNTRLIAGSRLKEGERNSRGTSRGNRNVVSLAESVNVVDSPSAYIRRGNKTGDDHTKLLMEFERWLKVENVKLNRICAEESSGQDGENTRHSRLQMLKSRVPQGQKLFEALLLCRPEMSVMDDLRLEDLRYRWMLYKSKLRDSGNLASLNLTHEPRDVTKKSGGICSFLHRVCCAALPLQLLLLLLLFLAFLLPLVHENQNCALANNFARSFNLMLKYNGPPPT